MANKQLFTEQRGPTVDARNAAGGIAYAMSPKHVLAQYAFTGCLNNTYYTDAKTQLTTVTQLCDSLPVEYVAKVALAARQDGFMKDLPALLLAHVLTRDTRLFKKIFPKVIDNVKMLRTLVQIVLSGHFGRRGMGSVVRQCVSKWLEGLSDKALFNSSIGQDPSMKQLIKLSHPKPDTDARSALYGYLIDGKYDPEKLPEFLQLFEKWKRDADKAAWTQLPDVNFQFYTGVPNLPKEVWKHIAMTASWQTLRMNLNTFQRHGVFEDVVVLKHVADKLCNEDEIKRSRVFPYQLLMAYKASSQVHMALQMALQDAMEIATRNVPSLDCRVAVFPDVSGSMSSPVTGYRGGATSKVQCVDVAALVASCILRTNVNTLVLPFATEVSNVRLNPRDSIVTNAQQLAKLCGGGTYCSKTLEYMNDHNIPADLCIYVSDNESWMGGRYGRCTETEQQWDKFKKNNPNAKMICIDITPNSTSQVKERDGIINIGGFSDNVFALIQAITKDSDKDFWVRKIEETPID